MSALCGVHSIDGCVGAARVRETDVVISFGPKRRFGVRGLCLCERDRTACHPNGAGPVVGWATGARNSLLFVLHMSSVQNKLALLLRRRILMRVLAVLCVLLMAAPAMAGIATPRDRSNTPIFTAEAIAPVGEMPRGTGDGPACYENMAGYVGYLISPTAIYYDDYVMDGSTGQLTAVKFIGGVSVLGPMYFTFFTFDGFTGASSPINPVFAGSFGVSFPQTGAYIWTIHNNSDILITVPHSGMMQISMYGAGGTGLWYVGSTASPTVGYTDMAHPAYQAMFALHVPEPGTLALLCLGGFTLIRRRR